jgi:hypothetical protein
MSVSGAINALAQALSAQQAVAATKPATPGAASANPNWTVGGDLWTQFSQAGASNSYVMGQGESKIVADWNAKPQDFIQEYNNFKSYGGSLSALDAYWHLTPGTGLEYAAKNGLPAYAKGGVFSQPSVGVFGEAGPEAVMPLARGSDGRLGVRASSDNSGNSAALLAEMQAMRAELAGFRSDQSKVPMDTREQKDLLVRVTRNGNSVLTTAA